MRRNRSKRTTTPASEPTFEDLSQYVQQMANEHQKAWRRELMGKAPCWECLIAMHLRMVELEHLESAVQEFL